MYSTVTLIVFHSVAAAHLMLIKQFLACSFIVEQRCKKWCFSQHGKTSRLSYQVREKNKTKKVSSARTNSKCLIWVILNTVKEKHFFFSLSIIGCSFIALKTTGNESDQAQSIQLNIFKVPKDVAVFAEFKASNIKCYSSNSQ